MKKEKRTRINLTVDNEIYEFAKQWSYITGKSISRLFDDFFRRQKRIVYSTSPVEYLSNPNLNPDIREAEEFEKERVHARAHLLRLKEEELNKKKPNPTSLKMFNASLEELDQSHELDEWSQIDKMSRIQDRWDEVFPWD